MKSVLLIEDDIALSKEIKLVLEKWGYEVNLINDFQNIMKEFINTNPHLVIMDVNLPFFDGFYWCSKIREVSKTPIIYLSSRDSNMDVIMGINNGGDDYITKPFSEDLLITKISAVLRRTYDYSKDNSYLIYCEDLILDVEKGEINYKNNKLDLTKNEIRILALLMKSKGKVVSREKLMMSLWEDDEFVNDNALTVNINRIRNRLKEIGIKDFIKTKKGIGYII
ncbi:response regulator transcription factor [Clostridium frigidicarnis]|uniref:Stage 0 sporulation protein A homolog n=1 Tax=Clostridium frigidicarnis TaxID=84698 RepID=A0A1I0WRX0_9CLOT|nr:response regulator transcription factor [Clostridium frigidicarnis]SFA91519.1 DNA-binding response regulator, OmpR family, contains REC and winged-helix (wHTH) domain [Clostridium frigidicarnis]